MLDGSKSSIISIHALLAESDDITDTVEKMIGKFLSTLSLRRATGAPVDRMPSSSISIHALLAESDYGALKHVHEKEISIHALLAESDLFFRRDASKSRYFYPRSPCGERRR